MADCVGEIMKGLRCYFDKALPVMLLYKSERQQYEETVVDDVDPSTIYGAEHLLRLFGMHRFTIMDVDKSVYCALQRVHATFPHFCL